MKLVAVLRQPGGLFALVSRRRENVDLGALLNGEAPVADGAGLFEVCEMPLADVPAAVCPQRTALQTAWDALRAARGAGASCQEAALTVLRGTVVGAGDESAPLVLALPAPPVPIAPTAAHPRAYRGTKRHPPTPRTPSVVDLRPNLCLPQGLAALSWLGEDGADAAREFRLPPLFRTHLLPRVKGEAATRAALLALFWRLEMDANPALLAAVTRLACLQGASASLRWLDLLAEVPAARRALFCDLLLETGACNSRPDGLDDMHRRLLVETAQEPRAPSRLYSLFRARQHGVPFAYMAAGFRLDVGENRSARFHAEEYPEIVAGAYYPTEAMTAADAHWALGTNDSFRSSPLRVWRACGRLAGLGVVIESTAWQQYGPEISLQYLDLYLSIADHACTPEQAAEISEILAAAAARFEALLRDTPPEYHAKLLTSLAGFWWQWETPETFRHCLPALDTLLRRLCRPPFRIQCDLHSVGGDFLESLDADGLTQFLSAPDAVFQRWEDACRRDNGARLCGFGTWTLARLRPEWLLKAFLLHPAKLFKVCKLLGSFSHAQRAALVRQADFEDVAAPMPRLLREQEAGTRRLPESQQTHYRQHWQRQGCLRQLERLEAAALTHLADGFPADPRDESVRHALQMQWDAGENRRALRRFLRAYWDGQADYLLSHPRTRAWLKRHPTLDLALWQHGLPRAGGAQEWGTLSLSVEQDPLEALKLGTYVGSCLGLGGSFSYSAAAAVLDINKQVLYVRREDDSVLARQLLAISEEEHLVCFGVYPPGVSAEVRRHVADYDRRFAQALGLALWRENDGQEYTVETILAHDWWDDGCWGDQRLRSRHSARSVS